MDLRQLYPPDPATAGLTGSLVDAASAYFPEPLRTPTGNSAGTTPSTNRPWVRVNMVASVDGAMTVEGRSGGLSNAADRAIFHLMRSTADAIVVGAGTARTERYGPARISAEDQQMRLDRGQTAIPPIVIVSGSGNLDPSLPFLNSDVVPDAPQPVIITTTEGARRAAPLARSAELVVAGALTVDLPEAMAALADRNLKVIVSEGGPTLNAAMLAEGLIDELCMTMSPLLVSGQAGRIIAGHDTPENPAEPVSVELAHILEHDGALFTRWRVAGPASLA